MRVPLGRDISVIPRTCLLIVMMMIDGDSDYGERLTCPKICARIAPNLWNSVIIIPISWMKTYRDIKLFALKTKFKNLRAKIST